MKLFYLFVFFSANLFAEPQFYTFKHKGASKKVEIILYKNKKVDSNCFKKSKSCLAIKALTKKVGKQSSPGNPYSFYCQKVKGRPIILEDSKRNQYDFCQFRDESMINSFDLYKGRAL